MKRFLYKIIEGRAACQRLSNKHRIIMRESERQLLPQKQKDNSPEAFKRSLPCQE